MFCPKCGTALAEGSRKCDHCGFAFAEEVPTETVTSDAQQPKMPEEAPAQAAAPEHRAAKKLPVNIVFYVLAALVLIMSLYAARCVISGGLEIGSIESVGGKTLEEAYYQSLGTVFAGYAAMIRATGIFFASILAYIGLKS